MKLYIVLAALLAHSALSKCPNACNGHGTCNIHDQCTCFAESGDGELYSVTDKDATTPICFPIKTETPCAANAKCHWDASELTADKCKLITKDVTQFESSDRYGTTSHKEWTGADCSRRTCPRATSWTELGPNEASKTYTCSHQTEVECSDQGSCDRATGQCDCFPGYTGAACQRTQCPDDCSGHGICRSNKDFAYDFAVAKSNQMLQTDLSTERFKENYVVTYDNAWDSGYLYGCLCDVGYRGPSCALVECPSANDPLDDKCSDLESSDVVENFQVQKFAATGSLGWQEAYTLSKSAEQSQNLCNIAANVADKAKCEAVAGPNGAKCIFTAGVAPAPNTCVEDSAWHIPAPGDKNNHFYQGKVYACFGAMSGMDCSGRGICDYSNGQCSCFSGYSGTACNNIEELV